MKEVHSQLPEQIAVAVELRKEKEREEDKKDCGRTDQPAVTVTLRADSDSDTDAPTIVRANSDSDNDFTPMNPELAEDYELVIARTILKSVHIGKSDGAGPSAVADTAKEKNCGDAFRSRGFGQGKMCRGCVCSSRDRPQGRWDYRSPGKS